LHWLRLPERVDFKLALTAVTNIFQCSSASF
jgi:hypothetical protein